MFEAAITALLAMVGWMITVERRLSVFGTTAKANQKNIDELTKEMRPVAIALGYAQRYTRTRVD